jgi:hypothetical protein
MKLTSNTETINEQSLARQSIFNRLGRLLTGLIQKAPWRNIIIHIVCALFIILFIYTGVNKLLDYNNFKLQMGRSPFIGNMNGFIAATLPAGEILLSFALAFKRTRQLGLYLSFLLMALFTGYIWLMLNYAPDLPCTCGGILAEMDWYDHLYFNAAFTGLSLLGLILNARK